jgi:hypothetical protein
MSGRVWWSVAIVFALLLGSVIWIVTRAAKAERDEGAGAPQPIHQVSAAALTDADDFSPAHSSPKRLPETAPPVGLPIAAWGARDSFPVIRTPWYVSAQQGDGLLATNEPVLGLWLGGQARAYSTNQLNEHEMVLDDIAGTPVLVTY